MKPGIAFLTPAGAAFALICFFLPWGRFSCAAVSVARTGPQLGGSLWIVFGAAGAVLVASAVLALRGRFARARGLLALLAAAGLAVLVLSQMRLAAGARTPIGRMHPEEFGVKVGFGGIGTAVGLVVALLAAAWPAGRIRSRPSACPRTAAPPPAAAAAARPSSSGTAAKPVRKARGWRGRRRGPARSARERSAR